MAQYSGHYLFDVLNEQDKQKFKFNYETAQAEFSEFYSKQPITFEQFLDEVYHNMFDFKSSAFIWDNTPEGNDYWIFLHNEIL
jgi:hypothetical protein